MVVPELPFGGVGLSGVGQHRGADDFDRLSHLMVMKRRRRPGRVPRFPPYTMCKFKLLNFLN